MEPIRLSQEAKHDLIQNIRQFYIEQRDEDISEFQAENFLQLILETIGPAIYNQAIDDAYLIMAAKTEELYGLQKRAR
jgi:uncharacterized protein (DUF2164 family)